MVAVGPAGVGHHGDVVGGGVGGHLEQLGQAAQPHDVGLDNVEVAVLDEFAEAEAGVLVLARGELDGGVGALDQLEAVRVVRGKALLPPVDVEVGAGLDQVDGVADVEAHVAVHHDGEVGPHGLAVLAEELDILAQADVALVRAEGKRDLGAPEPHVAGGRGLGPGAVKVDALLGGAADHAEDGLVPDLA